MKIEDSNVIYPKQLGDLLVGDTFRLLEKANGQHHDLSDILLVVTIPITYTAKTFPCKTYCVNLTRNKIACFTASTSVQKVQAKVVVQNVHV